MSLSTEQIHWIFLKCFLPTHIFSLTASVCFLIMAEDTYRKIHLFILGNDDYPERSQCDYEFFSMSLN